MPENYYDILNLLKSASDKEIKSAYRKLAIKYHPDKNPRDKVAEEKFREATEAYEILIDPKKREKYDSQFSWSQSKSKRKIKRQGTDLRVTINVNRSELIQGKEKLIVIKRKGLCKKCDGTGSMERIINTCIYCNGTGLQGLSLALGQRKKCIYCKGVGKIPGGIKCPECRGSALAPERVQKRIIFNPFSESIVIPELGNYCFGGEAGNLIIDLIIKENPNYRVQNLNIIGKIKISPAQAILGDILNLSVFDKKIKLKIPSGIINRTIELENKGITYEGKTGYFRAIINIAIPSIISDQEKELYQNILQIEKETLWPKVLNF